MEISPALIPHSEFHHYSWLHSVQQPGWDYSSTAHTTNIISNKNFMGSVDPPLKELVNLLHKAGIKTTPSCSGHHKSPSQLTAIFKQLQKDETEIRMDGLPLLNVETAAEYLFKDADYRLPWSEQEFINEVMDYQRTGIIGLRFTGTVMKEKLLNASMPCISVYEKDGIVFLSTTAGNEKETALRWKIATAEIKYLLR